MAQLLLATVKLLTLPWQVGLSCLGTTYSHVLACQGAELYPFSKEKESQGPEGLEPRKGAGKERGRGANSQHRQGALHSPSSLGGLMAKPEPERTPGPRRMLQTASLMARPMGQLEQRVLMVFMAA